MNKRWISLLLSICLLFTAAPAFGAGSNQTAGDMDGNGVVDAADVQAFADALAKGKSPAKAVADVTQDGLVGLDDLQALSQHVSGISRTARILSENGFTGPVYTGIAARLEVAEHFMPFQVGGGFARVTNPALSYDSGDLPLSFEVSGRALYCHFDTAGLTPSDGYLVRFTLLDRNGGEIPSAMPGQPMTVAPSPALRQMTLTASADMQLVLPTMSMAFTRLYNYDAVQASHLGDMGYGWTHSFDIYVLEYTDGLTGVHMPSGAARWFKAMSAGLYTPLYGDTGALTRDGDGKYRLQEQDGSMYGFYKDGSLQFIMNAGRELLYFYRNAKGQITKAESSFKGVSVQFKYTDAGRIQSIKDQYGRTTKYEYDPTGTLLTTVTAPDGATTRYTYVAGAGERADNRLSSIETAGGVFTHFIYDDQGRLAQTTGTWGANPVRYDYDDAMGDVRVTDAAGAELLYRRDPATGAVTAEVGGVPMISGSENSIARPKAETEYDAKGNPIRVTYADGSSAAAEYNSLGLMTSYTAPNGSRTTFKYTQAGQLESVTNAEGIVITLSYDKYGSVSAIRDAAKKTTSFKRDIMGRITAVTYQDGTKETYTYRADGALLSKTDAAGKRTEYAYDLTGRLETCTFADGTALHYAYDARGSLASVTRTDAAGQETAAETIAYDVLGNVVSTAHSIGGVSAFDVSVYGNAWDRIGYGYSDGYGVNYEYDASGRMIRVSDGGGTIAEYEYDPNGQVSARRYGNGVSTQYERDAKGNVTAIREYDAEGVLRDETVYAYDANGNCVSEITPFGESAYTYDKADRLTGAVYRDGTAEAFIYDKSGNVASHTVGEQKAEAKFSNMNRVSKAGNREYSWDANGNLTRIKEGGSVTELTWSLEGRLTGVTRDGERVSYAYDPLGRLSSRADKDGTVYYEWDYVTGNLAAVRNENGTVVLKYVYGPEAKEPLALLWDTGRAYFRQDKNHSIVGATDLNGNYTDRQLYSAYGELLYGGRLCDYGYAGMLQDETTGLMYVGERWYDPQLCAFISQDKESVWDGMLGTPSDPRDFVQRAEVYLADLAGNGNLLNRYAYALCNPMKYWDPDGRKAVSISGGTPGAGLNRDDNTGIPVDYPLGGTGGTGGGGGYGGYGGGGYGGGGGGGCCPTFIQVNGGALLSQELPEDVSGKPLSAKITVPVSGAYLRSDIPIFGVAGGEGFDHYTVEYASASSPDEWVLIESSETPQNTTNVAPADIWNMQGDIDIRGNLATWNTGLKNWEHLPWHPEDEEIDVLGDYILRLTAYGTDGTTVQDSVSVVVGDVAAQCLGGSVHSTDGLFEMQIEPLSLSAPFRVFSAKPAEIAAGSDRIVSALYEVSPSNEIFLQSIKVRFATDNLNRAVALYDAASGEIAALNTFADEGGVCAYVGSLPDKGVYFALLSSDTPAKEAPAPAAPQEPVSDNVYCALTFDGDTGSFESADGASGADVFCENGYLVLENRTFGGSFGASCVRGPVDAAQYPVLSFDYCVLPGVKLDLYLLVKGRYYNINFTDDPQGFKNTDMNIASAGSVSGVIADGEWHTASVRLDKALALATRETVIDGIFFRDLDVTGYMKLDTGSNPAAARLLIDNFSITALPEGEANEIVIDAFAGGDRNLLGGGTGVFYGEDDSCAMAARDGALLLTWDTGENGGYAGYWSDLGGLPLEGVTCLKADFASAVPENLRFGVRCGGKEASVAASAYAAPNEDGGYSVAIPLEALGSTDRDSADVVFFSAEGQGEALIQRISLFTGGADSEKAQGPVSVFDEARWSSFSDGAGAVSFGPSDRDGDETVCRVSYGGSIGKSYGGRVFSYAGWAQETSPLDARGYEYLVLNICGEAGGEQPNVYLDDGTTRKCVLGKDMEAITAESSLIRIPLHEFARKGVDLSHVSSVQLVFEWEEMSGTVYVSDITFE